MFRNITAQTLCVLGIVASFAFAADERSAAEILKDYDAVKTPKFDPEKQKDSKAIQEFRREMTVAETRKGELALELFRAHPENERVPKLLLPRWQMRMMNPGTAGETIDEIEQALPRFKDEKLASDASYMKAIAAIYKNKKAPDTAISYVDEFIRNHPKNERGALLLRGLAGEIDDSALKLKLLKRLIAEFPESPVAKSTTKNLELLESVGKPFALEFTDAIQGTKISIESLKGKVVVLDFWATWCGPCVGEMPRMKTLYAKYKDQGVEFIGVSLDEPEEDGGLDRLKAFVTKNEISWPQYYQGKGWESEFSQKLGIDAIPQLFLIDADGNLASINARGQLDELIPQYLEKAKKKEQR